MVPLYKLKKLIPSQRRRKMILMFTMIEKSLREGKSFKTYEYSNESIKELIELIFEDPLLTEDAHVRLLMLLERESTEFDILRIVNEARNILLNITGMLPAEWDLISPGEQPMEDKHRRFFPGVMAYAEDIRSPFNVGSIFRTAETFGVEKLFVSPLCASPEHQRAKRSAMGCIDFVPWEVKVLSDFSNTTNIFALETGGTPIQDFEFPKVGLVVLGSEELGISPESLDLCTYGRVSIPMHGIKASLNVSVAFGIVMHHWSTYLATNVGLT